MSIALAIASAGVGGSGGPGPGGFPLMFVRGDLPGLNNGDAVTTWTDRSPNGNSPTTGGTGATYNATGGPNSLPCLSATGSTDLRKVLVLAQPWEMWLVAKWDNSYASATTIFDGGSLNASRLIRLSATTIGFGAASAATYAGLQSWTIYHAIWNGASSSLVAAGTVLTSANPGESANPNGVALFGAGDGVSVRATASIEECIIYSSLQTAAVRSATNAYLKLRTGLTGE